MARGCDANACLRHHAPSWEEARAENGACRHQRGGELTWVSGAALRALASWRWPWAACSCWSRSCRARRCALSGAPCGWGPRPRDLCPPRAGWRPPGMLSSCSPPGAGAAWLWGECLRGLRLWASPGSVRAPGSALDALVSALPSWQKCRTCETSLSSSLQGHSAQFPPRLVLLFSFPCKTIQP